MPILRQYYSRRVPANVDPREENEMAAPPQSEWTLALIKPDAVKRGKAEVGSHRASRKIMACGHWVLGRAGDQAAPRAQRVQHYRAAEAAGACTNPMSPSSSLPDWPNSRS